MLKKIVLLGVDIYTLRNVDRLTKLNNNEFNSITQYSEIISDYSEDLELDQDMDGNTGDADLFSVKIKEEQKKMYKCYA